MKKIVTRLAAAVLACTVSVMSAAGWGFDLHIDEQGNGEVINVKKNPSFLVIENISDGSHVTALRAKAFKNCSNTRWFFIPDGVTEIDDCSVGYYLDDEGSVIRNEDVTVYVESDNSAAAEYARENGFEIRYYKEALQKIMFHAWTWPKMKAELERRGISYITVPREGSDIPQKILFGVVDCEYSGVSCDGSWHSYCCKEEYAFEKDGIFYRDYGDSVTVTGFEKAKTGYVLPDSVSGKPVTGIDPMIFRIQIGIDENGNWEYDSGKNPGGLHILDKQKLDEVRIILPENCTKPFLTAVYSNEKVVETDPFILVTNETDDFIARKIYYYPNSAAAKMVKEKMERSTEYCELKFGDVNFDGRIDVTDISLTAAHLKSIRALDECGKVTADADRSEKLDITDLSVIAAHVKGIKKIG